MIAYSLDAPPVVDLNGRLVGVVAEADAVTKLVVRGGADRPPLLAGARRRARWRRASGVVAADLMTAPAITVTGDTPLTTAVHVLADYGVRRVYVVERTGRLVGVLTRQHALRVFMRGDSAVVADVERELAGSTAGPCRVTVRVVDGIVTLEGTLTLHSAVERAIGNACQVPGVVAVRSTLDVDVDVDDLMITGL